MNIGECVEVRSRVLGMAAGTVVYVHPERRFAVVEFSTPWGGVRESFYLLRSRGAGQEPETPGKALPCGHTQWNHGMTRAQQAVAKARIVEEIAALQRIGVSFPAIAERLHLGRDTARRYYLEAFGKEKKK